MRRILVVDDEADIRDILSEYLGALGFEVTGVGTGREALDLLQNPEQHFDLALVDWSIPGIDGRDVVQQIHEYRPRCVIYAITGYDQETVTHSNVGDLLTGVFRKPFSLKSLGQELEKKFLQKK